MDELATDPARASQGRIVKLIPCDHCGEFSKLPGLKNVVSTVDIVFFFFFPLSPTRNTDLLYMQLKASTPSKQCPFQLIFSYSMSLLGLTCHTTKDFCLFVLIRKEEKFTYIDTDMEYHCLKYFYSYAFFIYTVIKDFEVLKGTYNNGISGISHKTGGRREICF